MKMATTRTHWLAPFLVLVAAANTHAQAPSRNLIPVAVPFLVVAPDARSAGMGDVGAATQPDANAGHWNPAKFAFADKALGVSLSHSPWLRALVPDMSLSYVSAYRRISTAEVVAVSLRYFDMGNVQLTNTLGQLQHNINPRDLAVDATYSRQLSRRFALAGTVRFIHSNLDGNVATGTLNQTGPANTAAVDVGWFYQTKTYWGALPVAFGLGMNLSNLGGKISYGGTTPPDFLPANLRLGTAFTGELDEYNKLTFALDINKWMAPTPGQDDPHGQQAPKTLVQGTLGSFADAPGGWREELSELMYAMGIEYWYKDMVAFRGGYYNEHRHKGGRKYVSLGLGLRYQAFGIDFAYLMPQAQATPLSDTLRFSLLFGFERGRPQPDDQAQARLDR
jgi:hypothetical protein